MSYISTMAVTDGIIMMADMRSFRTGGRNDYTDYSKKLFTMGDNIGIAYTGKGTKYLRQGMEPGHLIDRFCREYTYDDPRTAAHDLYKYIHNVSDLTCTPDFVNKLYALDGEDEYLIQIAGYFKHEG
jgi:hypothetical protein